MGKRSLVPRLNDILRNIDFLEGLTAGKTADDFACDQVHRLAAERAIEIISEASRHIPEQVRAQYQDMPWRSIFSIGNVFRHEYEVLDPAIIWDVATEGVQKLKPVIEDIKAKQTDSSASSQEQQSTSSITSPTRIDKRFAVLKKEGRAALVTFISAGDPDLETSRKILLGLPKAGADVIELGMPFSDPMADGPAIQASSLRALKAGQTMNKTLALVAGFRKTDQDTPIVLMGYYNPIYVYPSDKFLDDAVKAGVDGLIVVDVPPEADDELCLPAIAKGLNFIRLATPTTDAKRLPAVLNNTSGFLYYVSITGITGSAAPDINSVHSQVARIKRSTKLPVAVGFGVKEPEQARAIAKGADGVVVGSALVTAIQQSLGSRGEATGKTVPAVLNLVTSLSAALRPA